MPYGEILKVTLSNTDSNTTLAGFDANMAASYSNVVANGSTVQYWYDEPVSLGLKYAWASQQGLRGVGPFTFTDLDPANFPRQSEAMWSAFDVFVG